jgi:transcription-repair coupling factor (superfamily II helicase)
VGFELYQSMLEDAILAPRRANGLERDARGLSPRSRRCADHDPRGLRPRSGRAHGALSPHERCRGSGASRGAVRRNDRPLRPPAPATANLVQLIQIKRQAIEAHIAKIDVGAKGTLVSFHNDSFPIRQDWSPMSRLEGTIKLRPDNKLVVQRAWGDPKARLNGLLQLTKGLAQIVRKKK